MNIRFMQMRNTQAVHEREIGAQGKKRRRTQRAASGGAHGTMTERHAKQKAKRGTRQSGKTRHSKQVQAKRLVRAVSRVPTQWPLGRAHDSQTLKLGRHVITSRVASVRSRLAQVGRVPRQLRGLTLVLLLRNEVLNTPVDFHG